MRKAAFTLLGALLIAGSAVPIATASEHHMRTDRGHHAGSNLQSVEGALLCSPQVREGYNYGKPPVNESRTCDIKWCYAD